jgi:cell wall-associated NlpC family hydrolase
MPEVNDSVLLYFPTCKEEEAVVTTSVRRQESESERLQDPNEAYLRTGFEKELMFKEGQITLTGKDQGLHIYLDQKQGITIESPSELALQADNNLTLQAGRNLVISAQGDQSAIQLKHKDGKGNNLILNADGGIGFKGKVEKEEGGSSRDDGCDIEPTDTNIDKNDEFKYDMDLRKLNNKQRDKRKKELDKELLVQLERGAHAKTNDEKEDAINKVNKILVEYDELKKIANDKTFIRSQIAEAAKSLAGSLYVSGGSEMGGVDCRGTVFYSYKTAGVDLPNSTAQGYHDMMTPIDKSELKPGDIITYLSPTPNRNGDYITHVQVYIGEAIDKWGNLVYDGVINASPNNGLYIVSLEKYNSWSDVIETPNYGTLLDKY